jgi:hypothetical protein
VAYGADGTALGSQLAPFTQQAWQLTAVDLYGNNAQAGAGFTTGAAQLTSYDPLALSTLDGRLWQGAQSNRTVVGGQGLLFARADDMQGRLVQGLTYSNQVNVATGGQRVTTLQADVTVPSASASRGGSATAIIVGGLRINYQPAANRLPAFPASNMNFTTVGVELYDGGSGPQIRARAYHCDDPACITFSNTGITPSAPPAGFTQSGGNVLADAAYDQTYTFTASMNESTGVFTWTVAGGAFGGGVSGTADLSAWVSAAGMQLNSSSNGFSSAQLMARVHDESVAGGGYGTITPEFDNVSVGMNGAAAALFDDFATMGSSAAAGFGPTKWGAANVSLLASAPGVQLHAAYTAPGTSGGSASSTLSALYPATFDAWQADVTIDSDTPGGGGTDQVQMGGTFFSDNTAGVGPNNPLGGILVNLQLRTNNAWYIVLRCAAVANGGCSSYASLASGAVPTSLAHPLGAGTTHTLFEAFDPASLTFTFRVDDAAPLQVTPAVVYGGPARVPGRYIQAGVFIPAAPAGTSATLDATVSNVQFAP